MAGNQKYYYMRLKENFFDTESMIVLESMPDGHLYSNILLKLYLRSLKNEGRLMFNDRIPYNTTILAQITRHSVGVVEKALEIFRQLELIEVLDNGAIYLLDIQEYIGRTSTEADRKRAYRNRISQEKTLGVTDKGQMSDKCPDKTTPEIEIELELELDKEIKKKEPVPYQKITDLYNSICTSYPRLTKLSDARKKAIKARLNTYTTDDFKKLFTMAEDSDFLKGQNDRNWSATFDWLIKDSNMAKVLDGNYKNSVSKPTKPKTTNKFNQFPQREYTEEQKRELEQKLINRGL